MSPADAYFSPVRRCGSLFLRSSGFSVVELIVSLCVVGVLASLAAPNLGLMYQNYQLQTTARQLVTDLQFAKMRAVSKKVQYQVAFDGANNRYSIQAGNSSIGSTTWTQIGIYRSLSDPANAYYAKGITFTENFTGDTVIFSPTGQIMGQTSNHATTFTSPDYTRQVVVTLSGGIYVQ